MGTTTNLGLPYMENTDPLANVADAMQSLAEAVDAFLPGKMKFGSTALVFSAAGEAVLTHQLGRVPLGAFASQRAGGAGTALLVAPKNGSYTATQLTLVARNGAAAYTGGTLNIDWLVIG